jgi:hypothetical protein
VEFAKTNPIWSQVIVNTRLAIHVPGAVLSNVHQSSAMCRNLQEPSGTFRNLQESSAIFSNVQESSGIFRDLQEPSGIFKDLQFAGVPAPIVQNEPTAAKTLGSLCGSC